VRRRYPVPPGLYRPPFSYRPRFWRFPRWRYPIPVVLPVRGGGWWYPFVGYGGYADYGDDRYDTTVYYSTACAEGGFECADSVQCCSASCYEGVCEEVTTGEEAPPTTSTEDQYYDPNSYLPPADLPYSPELFEGEQGVESPPAGFIPDEGEAVDVPGLEDVEGELQYYNGTYFYTVGNQTYFFAPGNATTGGQDPQPPPADDEQCDQVGAVDGEIVLCNNTYFFTEDGNTYYFLEDSSSPDGGVWVSEEDGSELPQVAETSSESRALQVEDTFLEATTAPPAAEGEEQQQQEGSPSAAVDIPNEGDQQLQDALSAAIAYLEGNGGWATIWQRFFAGNASEGLPSVAATSLAEGECSATLPDPRNATGTFARVLDEGVLWVGSDFDYPPFAYRLPNGTVWGFEVDLIGAIVKGLSIAYDTEIEVQFVHRPVVTHFFVDLVAPLYDDHYDVVTASIFRTPLRQQFAGFTCPYLAGDQTAIILGPQAANLTVPEGAPPADLSAFPGLSLTEEESRGVAALNTPSIRIGFIAGTTRAQMALMLFPNVRGGSTTERVCRWAGVCVCVCLCQATLVPVVGLSSMAHSLIDGDVDALLYSYDVVAFIKKLNLQKCPQCRIAAVFGDAAPMSFVTRKWPVPEWLTVPEDQLVDPDEATDELRQEERDQQEFQEGQEGQEGGN